MSVDPGIVYLELMCSGKATRVQQHISFEWAKATKRFDILVALQNLPELDPELDAKLALIPNAAVQAAHVSRPGRDMGHLSDLAISDKRVAVQKHLASLKGLRPDAYAAMAKSSSRAVAMVLLANTDAPLATRRKAARTLSGAMSNASYAEKARFADIFGEFPELAEDLVQGALTAARANFGQAAHIYTAYLTPSRGVTASIDTLTATSRNLIIDGLAAQIVRAAGQITNGHRNYGATNRYSTLLSMVAAAATSISLSSKNRDVLLAAMTPEPPGISQIHKGSETHKAVVEALKNPPWADPHALTPERIALLKDPKDLADAAENLNLDSLGVAAIAAALVLNANTSSETVGKVLSKFSYRNNGIFRPALDARIKEREIALQIFLSDSSAITEERLDATGHRTWILKEICRQNPYWLNRGLLDYIDLDVVGGFAASELNVMRHDHTEPRLKELMITYLMTNLGDDPRRWELFNDLVTESPGSLEQVIEQIDTLRRLEQ